jgi:DNA-binding MarR family transcriptional regulator
MTGDTTINFAKILGQECVAMRIRLISRAISRIYDDALRPHGLKASQLSILALVSVLGRAEPSEVCRILQLDASTFSRNVTRMRSNGWLEASWG